jgi:hypothetical protein
MDPDKNAMTAHTPDMATTKIKDTLIIVSGIAMSTAKPSAERMREKNAEMTAA